MAELINEIAVYRGDDATITLNFADSSGNAIDITGYTIYLTVKNNARDSNDDALITKDVTSHTDPTNGSTEIHLTKTETNLTPRTYYYGIQMKDSGGSIYTVVTGDFNVKADYTRRVS